MPEPVEILIRKSEVSEGSAITAPEKTKEQGKVSMQTRAVNAAMINMAKTALIQGVHVYGDITGNYTITRVLDTTMSIGTDIATVAVGGPVGAIAVIGKYALQAGQSFASNYTQNREIEMQRMRVGNISVNGSRY